MTNVASPVGIHDLPIKSAPVTAIDFETTGLHPNKGDRAIEIALVRREKNGLIRQWSGLLNPQQPIPFSSQQIHHISNEMVQGAPTFQDIYPTIASFLKDSVVIAHNAPFDLHFLRKECRLSQCTYPINGPVIDTLTLARHLFGLPRCNLTALSERFGLVVHSAHRALFDAHNTLRMFFAMIDELTMVNNPTPATIQNLIEDYGPTGKDRLYMLQQLQHAAQEQYPLTIEYISSDPERPLHQQREISITSINPPHITAFCHLRQDKRHFRIDRIQKICAKSKLEGDYAC